jgi:ribosomal protein S18 acetylase RimI-like enzyme
VPDFTGETVQLVGAAVEARPDPEAVVLGRADLPQILALVERTAPGPFLPRTIELGTHLGIRRGGVLVAMAGERRHPPGWTEIGGVCTEAAHRGQGLATRLIRALAARIGERGEAPFLHAPAASANAVSSYEAIGFEVRRSSDFAVLSRL